MEPLVLYVDRPGVSPWAMHALVALEEKQLPYELVVVDLPMTEAQRAEVERHGALGKIPLLRHGAAGIGESLAISEYLAETFPAPVHPRIFPADLVQRARARQVMSWMRTGLFALREHRPTTVVFGTADAPRPLAPLDGALRADVDVLVAVATRMLGDRLTLADAWCIADLDLALALMRLVRGGDPLPAHLRAAAEATWARPSVQAYLTRRAQIAAR
jgi:glutathione S-transferase